MPSNEVTLSTGGIDVGGWTGATVRSTIDNFADDFSLEAPNHRIAIDGEPVLTGYVDLHDIDNDSNRSELRISGNSRVVDLIDSSAEHKSGAWKNKTLLDIARDLCLPYAITVVDANGVAGAAFPSFRVEKGEKVFDCISRAAEKRGVIVTCNPDGNVELITASAVQSGLTLELGVNVITSGCMRSTRGRHSVYKFKGQTKADDTWNGTKASQLKGEVTDDDVGRYRPLVILSTRHKSSGDMGARAIWERNRRAGESLRYRCKVEEWRDELGALWRPNTLVRVKDAWCGLDEDLLITTVEYSLSNTERVTMLELMPRVAFDPEPRAYKAKPVAAGLSNSQNANIAFAGNLFGIARGKDGT